MLRGPGGWLLGEVRHLVSYSALTVVAAVALVRRPAEGGQAVRGQIARQIVFSAWDGVPIVVFFAVMMSVSLVALSATLLPSFEATAVLGRLLTHVLVRELAPLMTAILIILRSCAAITVDLGNMSWRGEIESLKTMGIDPAKFLLLPRFVGLSVATVNLTMVYIVVAIGAGMITAHMFAVAPSLGYISANVESFLYPEDLVIAFVKSLLFGGTIAAIACYHGLSVRKDLTEVPRRVSRAVVEALSWCTVVGVAITLITL